MMDTEKIKRCSYLLGEPAAEIIRDLATEIERMSVLIDALLDGSEKLRGLLKGVRVDGFFHQDGVLWWGLRVPSSDGPRPSESIASMQAKFDAALGEEEE